MTTNPPKADARHVTSLKDWRAREDELVGGKAIPSRRDREAGHGPFQGSALLDLRQMLDIELDRENQPNALLAALMHCRTVPSASAIWAAARLVGSERDTSYLYADLVWHAALRVHRPAVQELLSTTFQAPFRYNPVDWMHAAALAVGLVFVGTNEDPEDELEAADTSEARDKGFEWLDKLASVVASVNAATESVDAEEDAAVESSPQLQSALAAMKQAQEKSAAEIDAEHLQDVLDDRAESRQAPPPTLLVVAGDPKQKQPGARADVFKAYQSVVGTQLPLVSTAAVPAARTALHARYPHMHVEIDAILCTQAALQSVRLAVLLVGEPGSGKTTFAREMADLLGVPAMTYSCAGASDGAFGGTSAQWNSARPATPMQHVGRSKVANPLIVLDEVDKIGLSRHNGSLADTLLTFLEPTSSRVFFDLALEQPVDLSAVSYIATANVIEDVPVALRDRFKIVRIPDAGFEHIGVLSQRIIDDLAKSRGLDRRWIEPLAQDETDLVRKAWTGGSLRTLTRIITMLVDGREQLIGRA